MPGRSGSRLRAAERDRIRGVVVVDSPGVEGSEFAGKPDVLIKSDPPEGTWPD